jgi:hypothetical protein
MPVLDIEWECNACLVKRIQKRGKLMHETVTVVPMKIAGPSRPSACVKLGRTAAAWVIGQWEKCECKKNQQKMKARPIFNSQVGEEYPPPELQVKKNVKRRQLLVDEEKPAKKLKVRRQLEIPVVTKKIMKRRKLKI